MRLCRLFAPFRSSPGGHPARPAVAFRESPGPALSRVLRSRIEKRLLCHFSKSPQSWNSHCFALTTHSRYYHRPFDYGIPQPCSLLPPSWAGRQSPAPLLVSCAMVYWHGRSRRLGELETLPGVLNTHSTDKAYSVGSPSSQAPLFLGTYRLRHPGIGLLHRSLSERKKLQCV